MEAMRDAWTDGRLDDLNQRVGDLGRRMDEGFTGIDAKIDFRIENLRSEMRIEFLALNRLILGFGGTLIAAVVADTIVGRL